MKHPFQQVLVGNNGENLYTVTKNTIQVFELKNGKLIGYWKDELDISDTLKKQQQEKVKLLQENLESGAPQKKQKSNDTSGIKVPKIPVPGEGAPSIFHHIRALTISDDESVLVGTTDSDKSAIVFSIDTSKENCLVLMKRQPFPKRPCAISIDQHTLIVADKFGDVYSIKIDSQESKQESDLVPILGHVSMLSDVLITHYGGKKFILTGDRDEHIRVTNYPKSFVIKDWLFGHREFVSELHIPAFDDKLLISGGGDDYFVLWKWHESELLRKIDIREVVEPYLDDSHLPPERYLTENSKREICVKRIVTHKTPESSIFILILCENTSCVLVYELRENYQVYHNQTLSLDHKVIDMASSTSTNSIYCSIDSDDKLLACLYFNETNELVVKSDESAISSITNESLCDVSSVSEVQPLYTTNTLRKRSDH